MYTQEALLQFEPSLSLVAVVLSSIQEVVVVGNLAVDTAVVVQPTDLEELALVATEVDTVAAGVVVVGQSMGCIQLALVVGTVAAGVVVAILEEDHPMGFAALEQQVRPTDLEELALVAIVVDKVAVVVDTFEVDLVEVGC